MSNQKQFEAKQFAKHHYRKLISAKSVLKNFKSKNQTLAFYPVRTLTPLDKYQYSMTNLKLSHKLHQIYKEPIQKLKGKHFDRSQYSKSVLLTYKKEKEDTLQRQNVQIFERILAAKSTITQDWKKREKEIIKYRNLSKRKINKNQQNMFSAYRQILTENRYNSTKKRRPKTSRPKSGKSRTILQ